MKFFIGLYLLTIEATHTNSLKVRIEKDNNWTEFYISPDLIISTEEITSDQSDQSENNSD